MVKKVIKENGLEEDFLKEKIVVSCYKTGLDVETSRKIADEIEKELREKEKVDTKEIRKLVLQKLKKYPEAKETYLMYDKLVKGRITYEDGSYVEIKKGNLYLGRFVKDVGEPGLSDIEEVEGILRELQEDLDHGISRQTIHRRTYILFLAVLRSKHMKKEDKIKAIELINEFRKRNGWKEFRLKKKIG